MSNTYFDFKQFRINQDRSGMKVTTDGCLFGALVVQSILENEPKQILDIGTGTGLLALMLAQSTKRTRITAVEIESEAYDQAKHNFETSPWNDRLEIQNTAIQEFGQYELIPPFDLIVSNPPFFLNSQLGTDNAKNQAIHNTGLAFDELADSIQRLIDLEGKAWVMYPLKEMEIFKQEMSQRSLFEQETYLIQDQPDSKAIREITCFAFQAQNPSKEIINIKDEEGNYTARFTELLQEFYLHL